MDLEGLILKNIDLAFKIAKSLTKPVTLVERSNVSFNFSTGNVEDQSSASKTISVFLLSVKRSDKYENAIDRQTMRRRVIAKTADIGALDYYEKLIINSVNWRISTVNKVANGVTVFEITLESNNG